MKIFFLGDIVGKSGRSTVIKNLQDNAKDMLDVHERQKRITADDPKARSIKTQNNLFVGSTKDLLKAIKEDDVKTIDVDPDATT